MISISNFGAAFGAILGGCKLLCHVRKVYLENICCNVTVILLA